MDGLRYIERTNGTKTVGVMYERLLSDSPRSRQGPSAKPSLLIIAVVRIAIARKSLCGINEQRTFTEKRRKIKRK